VANIEVDVADPEVEKISVVEVLVEDVMDMVLGLVVVADKSELYEDGPVTGEFSVVKVPTLLDGLGVRETFDGVVSLLAGGG
jgi:hypothetical protein